MAVSKMHASRLRRRQSEEVAQVELVDILKPNNILKCILADCICIRITFTYSICELQIFGVSFLVHKYNIINMNNNNNKILLQSNYVAGLAACCSYSG